VSFSGSASATIFLAFLFFLAFYFSEKNETFQKEIQVRVKSNILNSDSIKKDLFLHVEMCMKNSNNPTSLVVIS
jgi:hypothetical protein